MRTQILVKSVPVGHVTHVRKMKEKCEPIWPQTVSVDANQSLFFLQINEDILTMFLEKDEKFSPLNHKFLFFLFCEPDEGIIEHIFFSSINYILC